MQISHILDSISSPFPIASLSTPGSSIKLGRTAPPPSSARALCTSAVAAAHEPVLDFQGEIQVRFSNFNRQSASFRISPVSHAHVGVDVATFAL